MIAAPPVVDRRDRPLRDVRISVTDRCNFRCPYCLPNGGTGAGIAPLPRSRLLTFEQISRLAGIFVELGVRKGPRPRSVEMFRVGG